MAFPFLKTKLIAYPEGVSIVYTDSNPLLSIFFKLFRGVFPPEYQFFGFWFLLCWMLQSFLGYKLIHVLTGGNKLYSILSSFLFALIPSMVFRVSQPNLVAIWVIIWMFIIVLKNIRLKKLCCFSY